MKKKVDETHNIKIYFMFEEDGSIQNVVIQDVFDFQFWAFIQQALMSEKHLLPSKARCNLLTVEYEFD